MTIPAKDIIRRVVETLQDPTSVRWPISELARYFNDAQRAIVMYRPDAAVITAPVPLVPGTRQTLPAGATKMVRASNNSAGSKRVVLLTRIEVIDAQLPGWHNLPGTTEILHYMFDPREPRVFHTYPPAAPGAALQVTYATMPQSIAEPADSGMWESITGEFGLPDIYAGAAQDYILHWCYLKDAEYAGNAARAQVHKQSFAEALSIEIGATVALSPTPNRTA